jgi:uncharacterized membrane protein
MTDHQTSHSLSTHQPPTSAVPKPGRVEALDLFKFLILVFMIQGHLFRAYLFEPVRQAEWYRIHEILHGAAAAAFLFAAGFAAFLSYLRKQEQYIRPGKAFLRRLARILFVIWCSIWMRLPFFSLRKTLAFYKQKGLAPLFTSDILMCIGVSLLLFVGLALVLKKVRAVALASLGVGLVFFLLPRIVYDLHISPLLDPFLDYRLSPFPLFPWSGFLFLGVVCAYCYEYLFKHKERFFKILVVAGLIMVPWYFFYNTPGFHRTEWTLPGNLNKTGVVFLLFWLAYWLGKHFKGRMTELMTKAGHETLFVYILHIYILYHSIYHHGLNVYFSNSLSVPEALVLLFIVLFAVFLPALWYHTLKTKYPSIYRYIFYGFWLLFAVIFISRPY